MQVGRIFDDAAPNDTRKAEADRLNFLAFRYQIDLLLNAFSDVIRRHGLQRIQRGALIGIEADRAGEFVVLDQADRDVFHYKNADCAAHEDSLENESRKAKIETRKKRKRPRRSAAATGARTLLLQIQIDHLSLFRPLKAAAL